MADSSNQEADNTAPETRPIEGTIKHASDAMDEPSGEGVETLDTSGQPPKAQTEDETPGSAEPLDNSAEPVLKPTDPATEDPTEPEPADSTEPAAENTTEPAPEPEDGTDPAAENTTEPAPEDSTDPAKAPSYNEARSAVDELLAELLVDEPAGESTSEKPEAVKTTELPRQATGAESEPDSGLNDITRPHPAPPPPPSGPEPAPPPATDDKTETDGQPGPRIGTDATATDTRPDAQPSGSDPTAKTDTTEPTTTNQPPPPDPNTTKPTTTDQPATPGPTTKTDTTKQTTTDQPATPKTPSPPGSDTAQPEAKAIEAKPDRRPVPRALVVLLGTVVIAIALLVIASTIDTARHAGQAMRNVYIGATDVSGLDRGQIDAILDQRTDELSSLPLVVTVGESEITTDPLALGVRLDNDYMADQALSAHREGLLVARPFTWFAGLFNRQTVQNRYAVDGDAATEAASELIVSELNPAVEPEMLLRGEELVVTPGAAGITIDGNELIDLLPAAVESGDPYRLELEEIQAEPILDTDAVQAVADEINDQTKQSVAVQVLDKEVEIEPALMRSWATLIEEPGENGDDGSDSERQLGWTIEDEDVLEDLKPLFPSLGEEDQQAKFRIVNAEPLIVPASETVICCAEGVAEDVLDVLGQPVTATPDEDDEGEESTDEEVELRTVRLQPIVTDKDEGVAELESLGIIEEVSSFTTEHACCEGRVTNIQRFADLTQGVIIRPGEEFSLNGHVGERTRAKGFVAAGAIAQGNFEDQVGGGISQYATTFFNASFFAGIEFIEYQSHSIYISRYPRGREATISWRKPDLRVKNDTDYGILVWNDYTPTSITVTFYSTKHREVVALDRRRSSDRQCRIDITPRLITFEDGSENEDSVFAAYRPDEGLDCNGNPTTPPDEPEG